MSRNESRGKERSEQRDHGTHAILDCYPVGQLPGCRPSARRLVACQGLLLAVWEGSNLFPVDNSSDRVALVELRSSPQNQAMGPVCLAGQSSLLQWVQTSKSCASRVTSLPHTLFLAQTAWQQLYGRTSCPWVSPPESLSHFLIQSALISSSYHSRYF